MRILSIFALGLLIAGCGGNQALVPHTVTLVEQTQAVPEDELLDVSVVVFDSGVPDGEIEKDVLEELLQDGTFVHIRRTEARYMAVHLKETLQNSGHWGAVWTTPGATTAADINITAEILHSDGSQLRLRVRAADATGDSWIDDDYFMRTAAASFNAQQYPGLDPYQDVFNRIANDLAAAMDSLSSAEIRNIRTVAQLRFAAELSPEAFDDYVVEKGSGRYALSRLPADDDPQFERTRSVRDREHLFVDTLNEHYVGFYLDSKDPYHAWREMAQQEAVTIRELERSGRWRTVLGVAGIVLSVVAELGSDGDFSDRVLSDSLMHVSTEMLESGFLRGKEKQIHVAALEELSVSFDAQVKPMVVEIDGVQHRFTGTAETQYEDWRDLLRQIFEEETGLGSVEVYTEALRDEAAGDAAPQQAPEARKD